PEGTSSPRHRAPPPGRSRKPVPVPEGTGPTYPPRPESVATDATSPADARVLTLRQVLCTSIRSCRVAPPALAERTTDVQRREYGLHAARGEPGDADDPRPRLLLRRTGGALEPAPDHD